jgi:hypothetical protein
MTDSNNPNTPLPQDRKNTAQPGAPGANEPGVEDMYASAWPRLPDGTLVKGYEGLAKR